jgi:O-antigen ligase
MNAQPPPMARRVAVGALALTAASLPLYVVRWHIGPLPTTLLENLILLTVAAYIWVLWAERRHPAARTPYDFAIIALLIAGIVGVVVSPDPIRATGIYRAYFLEAIALFYIAVDLLRSPRDFRMVLLGGGVGASALAVGQVVLFGVTFANHSVQLGAAPSFLNTSSNAVALYLEPAVAIATGLVLFAGWARDRWLAVACLALTLIGTLFTRSRGAYGALAVLVAMVVSSLPTWRLRIVSMVTLLAAFIAFLKIPIIAARLSDVQYSILLRDSLYQQAFHLLSQRPLLGAGISGYPVRVAPFRPIHQTIELYPHNLWLTTWSELGLLGLVAFAVIFFMLIWRGFRALSYASDLNRAVIWGAVAALVLYAVHGMVDSPYWKNDLSVEFWLVAALEVAAIREALAARSGLGAAAPERGQLVAAKDPTLER